jgi:hypothetical protein
VQTLLYLRTGQKITGLCGFLPSKHSHVDTVITNVILKKVTSGSFHQWTKDDYDLTVTVIQKPHVLGGFGMTPNVITQTSVKVTMTPRFLGLVGPFVPQNSGFPIKWYMTRIRGPIPTYST